MFVQLVRGGKHWEELSSIQSFPSTYWIIILSYLYNILFIYFFFYYNPIVMLMYTYAYGINTVHLLVLADLGNCTVPSSPSRSRSMTFIATSMDITSTL